MDISALLSSSGASSAKSVDIGPVAAALRRPVKALSQQTESARVRLSAFGQVKSAVADVQSAAKSLQDNKQVQTPDGAKKAAEAFVKAFNTENRTAANLTRREDARNSAGALADEPRARAASSELQRAVRDSAPELKQVGITRQNDGSLAIDAKAFEAAYVKDSGSLRQSLSTVGNRVEVVTTRQLSASGSVGSAVNSLSSKVANLEDRQADVQTRFDQSQQIVQEQTDRFKTGPFATGVSAYKGIFSI
jgi:flagellar capping protein FliD